MRDPFPSCQDSLPSCESFLASSSLHEPLVQLPVNLIWSMQSPPWNSVSDESSSLFLRKLLRVGLSARTLAVTICEPYLQSASFPPPWKSAAGVDSLPPRRNFLVGPRELISETFCWYPNVPWLQMGLDNPCRSPRRNNP